MKCKILKEIGTLSTSDKGDMKLRLIEWDDNPAKYDLRIWKPDGKATSGMTFTKEDLKKLVSIFENQIEETTNDFPMNEPVVEEKPKKEKVIKQTKKATGNVYKQASDKLNEMFSKHKESPDYMYVLDGLLECAKTDTDFCNGVIQDSKTFSGMWNFAMNYSKKNGIKLQGGALLDNNQMLQACIDYFNSKK